MDTKYQSFKNWDNIDCEEYWCDKNRDIDNPDLNQDDASRKSQEEFDDSDDFHKYDDTDEDKPEAEDDVTDAGKYDGNFGI